MPKHPSHDQMRDELRHRGLPRAYIERFLSELDDHYTDLLEKRSTSMGAARKLQSESVDNNQPAANPAATRLGEPTQLAIFAAEQYHARTFWGRHPLLTYLVAPLPLVVACLIGYGLAFWAFGWAVYFVGTYVFGVTEATFANAAGHIWLQAGVLALFSWYVIVFPPLTTAALLCRTYRRNALDRRWPIIGCTLIAIVCGLFHTSYTIATEPNNGVFMLGLDWNIGNTSGWLLRCLPKFVIAMGIGMLLIMRANQKLQSQDLPAVST